VRVIDTKRPLIDHHGAALGYNAEVWAKRVWRGMAEPERAAIRDALVFFFDRAYPELPLEARRRQRKRAA
jgi:hypothetical protein